jgi:glucose-6-phosphate isomerase
MLSRRRLLILHEPAALEAIQAAAAILRLERSNVRHMYFTGKIDGEDAAELLRQIDERETCPNA